MSTFDLVSVDLPVVIDVHELSSCKHILNSSQEAAQELNQKTLVCSEKVKAGMILNR